MLEKLDSLLGLLLAGMAELSLMAMLILLLIMAIFGMIITPVVILIRKVVGMK